MERLAEALADPCDRDEAAEAIQGLIERIVLTLGAKRGEMRAALHGDLGNIIEWAGSGRGKRATNTPRRGVSVPVVAGACFRRQWKRYCTHRAFPVNRSRNSLPE